MTSKTSAEKPSKDFSTKRIDLEDPENTDPMAATQVDEKSRTRRTTQPATSDNPTIREPASPSPVENKPVKSIPPPAPPAGFPPSAPKNDRIWIAAIVAICVIILACLCACTIVGVALLARPPW